LGEIIFGLRCFRLVLNGLKRGKKKTDQNCNDRNDDKQLD